MNIEEFKQTYSITDSKLLAITLKFDINNSKDSNLITVCFKGQNVFSLQFIGVKEFYYFDTYDCLTISQSTLIKTLEGQFYLSLDPFCEGEPSDKDNMIIKSKEMFLIDSNGNRHQII